MNFAAACEGIGGGFIIFATVEPSHAQKTARANRSRWCGAGQRAP